MKIRPVAAELFHADRRTGMTQLRVAFRGFAKASKNVGSHCSRVYYSTCAMNEH